VRRPVDKLLEDLLLAADVADEIVQRGRERFEADEAVVGRIGDAASKLPEQVRNTLSRDIPKLRAAIIRYRQGGRPGG
jgi:hypothetical protein